MVWRLLEDCNPDPSYVKPLQVLVSAHICTEYARRGATGRPPQAHRCNVGEVAVDDTYGTEADAWKLAPTEDAWSVPR